VVTLSARVDDVRETLHGVEISDPYRWLEDTDDSEVQRWTAEQNAATASELPVLVRVDEDAGHGLGKPRSKQLDAATDLWTFVFWQLGVES
jgi:prolyl oligopeptidase PreP (S9A serine peptidase family)